MPWTVGNWITPGHADGHLWQSKCAVEQIDTSQPTGLTALIKHYKVNLMRHDGKLGFHTLHFPPVMTGSKRNECLPAPQPRQGDLNGLGTAVRFVGRSANLADVHFHPVILTKFSNYEFK